MDVLEIRDEVGSDLLILPTCSMIGLVESVIWYGTVIQVGQINVLVISERDAVTSISYRD